MIRDEHGITKTKKSVSFSYSFFISLQHMLPACEGADQHDQSGFRQVEICDQAVHRLKMITRINKNRSVVAAGVDDPVLIRRALNSAAAGRADADDAAACLVGRLPGACG